LHTILGRPQKDDLNVVRNLEILTPNRNWIPVNEPVTGEYTDWDNPIYNSYFTVTITKGLWSVIDTHSTHHKTRFRAGLGAKDLGQKILSLF
jgi:hypothetical protein